MAHCLVPLLKPGSGRLPSSPASLTAWSVTNEETGLAGHPGDPVIQLMRERKQFIAPNKCYSSKYQAATTLLIPLTITFRSYATANNDFKLFLPTRFSFPVRRGKPKKGLTDCCKQEHCEFSQFRPCQSSRTPQEVILTSIAFKKKSSLPQQFLHQGCTKQSFPGSGQAQVPG